MCLSTAYKEVGGTEYKIADYVGNVEISGREITLTDIMGSVTKILGSLKRVDLEKNLIIIEADA